MKKLIPFIFSALFVGFVSAQNSTLFNVSLQEITIANMPALQSFAWAKTTDGKWLLLTGRTDGLHDHRPPFAFSGSMANSQIFVVDPIAKQVWSASIQSLSTSLQNALTVTNAPFQQDGDVLYLVGGYGINANTNAHQTFPLLTAIDVTPLANAIINSNAISGFFKQITDERMRVTGGYLHKLQNTFYLIGGQNFDGRYNPHNGPSFTQTYADSYKSFHIVNNGGTLQITNYVETADTANLHRRDYNAVMQIFPNGDTGITAFSGVFQRNIDIPFFNSVDITANGYTVNNTFNQLLNQYHSANMPVFDAQANEMHTLLFGGIGMYYPDALGNILVDSLVPFVKTISRVSRFANDSMAEFIEPNQMPGFLGASAEFIPSDSISLLAGEIIDLNNLPTHTLAGYIVGGIESNGANIFMLGGTSAATTRVFKVYINHTQMGIENQQINVPFTFALYPNPASENVTVNIVGKEVTLELYNAIGQKIATKEADEYNGVVSFDLKNLAAGQYQIVMRAAGYSKSAVFVKK